MDFHAGYGCYGFEMRIELDDWMDGMNITVITINEYKLH